MVVVADDTDGENKDHRETEIISPITVNSGASVLTVRIT